MGKATDLQDFSMPRPAAERLVQEGMVTLQEACEFLGISRSRLYGMLAAGDLPSVKLGRCRRVPRRALIACAARAVEFGL